MVYFTSLKFYDLTFLHFLQERTGNELCEEKRDDNKNDPWLLRLLLSPRGHLSRWRERRESDKHRSCSQISRAKLSLSLPFSLLFSLSLSCSLGVSESDSLVGIFSFDPTTLIALSGGAFKNMSRSSPPIKEGERKRGGEQERERE